MLAEERKRRIVELLNQQGVVRVTDLSQEMDVAEATIRHDLSDLQDLGLAVRIHGGAKQPNVSGHKMTLDENLEKCKEERRSIGECGYKMIKRNDTIFLDSSATVLEVARCLSMNPIEGLTILTTSFPIFQVLSEVEDYALIFVGGQYNRRLKSTSGYFAQKTLELVHVDKAFIGVSGIDASGFSGPYEEETNIKHLSIVNSDAQYVLADHTKFFKSYLYRFAVPSEVKYLITDRYPHNDLASCLIESGLEIICTE